mgnify:CR=1 FL=1
MDLLIVLTYVALAWAVFKIFRIPVNQWTLATAALGGVFLAAVLLVAVRSSLGPSLMCAALSFLTFSAAVSWLA